MAQIRLISLFARHRVAANLLMAVMILSGLWCLTRINVQFLPNYNIDIVSVSIVWRGASAEDIENSIINPLEREFRDLDNIEKITSTAKTSIGTILVEFKEGTNMSRALEDMRERVSQVPNLPEDSEEPIIKRIIPYEPVAKLVITGPNDIKELRPAVRRFEHELLDRGIAKIRIIGLPEQEIAIQVPTAKLVELRKSLPDIAARVRLSSLDLPAGTIGKSDIGRQLRSLSQRRSIRGFEELPIFSDPNGQLIKLKDIATITKRPLDNEVKVYFAGKPAVEMTLLRTEHANALTSAKIFQTWLKQIRPTLGKSIQIHVYQQNWQYIKERINLLMKNGLGGLILIIIILFLFLNHRVALWTVIGIPTSFMAALAALYFYGGSINMVSLFAFIMSLGIIVDDTIVVGEQTLTNLHAGMKPIVAIENAANRMFAPIMSSSLTTVFAFLPLLLISGIIGTILFAIPMVVICVIFASVIECFLVLPGHLQHSFSRQRTDKRTRIRRVINYYFNHFKQRQFRKIITWSMENRLATISAALGAFVLAIALVIGGWVNFTFFPSPEGTNIQAEIQFTVGTPPAQIKTFLKTLTDALQKTNNALSDKGKSIVKTAVAFQNYFAIGNNRKKEGEQYASMAIELISPDQRDVSNREFMKAWKNNVTLPPGIESFSIYARRSGPPGEDIDVEFSGADANTLKKVGLELQNTLYTITGVSDVKDDLPFSQEQVIYELNATARSVGLTEETIGRQLRAAFTGLIAQIFHEPNEEIEVRVMLPDRERYRLATLEHYPIITASGKAIPLGTVVNLHYRKAPDVLLHTDTKLTIHVTAKVDNKLNNANSILANLQRSALPHLVQKYNVKYVLKGKAEEQAETLTDMKYGLMLGFTLIYIVLAWVFVSYGWPFIVMAAIPLGLTGAIFGHLVMGLDLTILSLFGLFGLSGIVINDSIILISEYRLLKDSGMPMKKAIVEASCRRLRAVILTSLTTIAGLTPLLFEGSVQAQFLIPMAVSISFGLAYATVLILIVVPTLLSLYEEIKSTVTL